MNPTQQKHCDAWIGVFTNLASNGVPSLQHLEQITSANVRFRDPFNELSGRRALLALLEHTRKQILDVKFEVLDTANSGDRAYLKWQMTGRVRVLGDWTVRGMSELLFDESGKLVLHQDYWDASEQFYGQLPIVGWLIRRLRSLAAIS